MRGALCISLDFEKFWGVHDVLKLDDNIHFSNVDNVVSEILDLFKKYNIHATWATVGMLNFHSLQSLSDFCNGKQIDYENKIYSPFPLEKYNLSHFDDELYLAKNTIEKIKGSKNQEIASHTFSHFYCLEKGTTETDFKNDINDFNAVFNLEPTSIVFPRNQVNVDYLNICMNQGFTAYRGNQKNIFWKNSALKDESVFKKAGRVIDAYLKISKDNFVDWKDLNNSKGVINIPASRFLRPSTFNNWIENLKINRIKKQMYRAAKNNMIYHLWWHPHNFSNNIVSNLKQLEEILLYQKVLNEKFQFQSLNMNEIAKIVE